MKKNERFCLQIPTAQIGLNTQERQNQVKKKERFIAFKCKYLLSVCVAKLDMRMENGRIWLVQAEKDLNRSVKI